jgi:hypothetical protein
MAVMMASVKNNRPAFGRPVVLSQIEGGRRANETLAEVAQRSDALARRRRAGREGKFRFARSRR